MSSSWTADEALFVWSEEARAFASVCPKCGAQPGAWCTDYATMHYERWGYGPLVKEKYD